jgi:hypothetical protein
MKRRPMCVVSILAIVMWLSISASVVAQGPVLTVPGAPADGAAEGEEQNTPTPTFTATATQTATPTNTATPTITPTPTTTVQACRDKLEPNNEIWKGQQLVINETYADLTLFPEGDVDFFVLWGKPGVFYEVTTITTEGLDTRLRVFDPSGTLIAENDDYLVGNPASQVTFIARGEGWFAVSVDSRVPTAWGCRHYAIIAADVSPPTATPTATQAVATATLYPTTTPIPTSTPLPTGVPPEIACDAFEPNFDFATAANIGVGQIAELNFNPWPPGSHEIDNDYFRLYVKQSEELSIETLDLAGGVDTNLILYRENGEVVAGNDDCVEGERWSCIQWAPDMTGVVYLLVGPVGSVPDPTGVGVRSYALAIDDVAGQAPTPVPASPYAQPTPGMPWPVTPAMPWTVTPVFAQTPTPVMAVTVVPMVTTVPKATPLPVEPITADLTVYYDENDNKAPDTGEGVVGIGIYLFDVTTNQRLGQAYTDAEGYAKLTVAAAGKVRVSVPYLRYSDVVKAPGDTLTLRLKPMKMPSLIP